jgi:hypothetical protein
MNGGIMKSHGAAVLAAALLLLPLAAYAADQPSGSSQGDGQQQGPDQTETPGTTPPDNAASDNTPINPFLPGEQTIGVAVGAQIPAFLVPVTGGGVGNIKVGGSFSFGYQYFLARGWAVGGEIAASFNGTIGGASVFMLPLGATAAYWWTKLPFEFSVFAETGVYMMRENGEGIFGPFAKAGVGAYWRVSPAWSVGLRPSLWFIPEIHYGDYSSLNQYGGFVEASLTAVYHL